MKKLLKSAYYTVKPQKLHPAMQLNMGYIFHTEAIQDPTYWPMLQRFCIEYHEVTGAQPICTIMTPVNARIARQMADFGVDNAEYVNRVRELETMAIIGHHGHYYKDKANYNAIESEIKRNNYSREHVVTQFREDLQWFRDNDINHNGLYAAGWWFMHRDLIALMIEEGYRVDFSFTYSPVFGHEWSKKVLRDNNVPFGTNFRLQNENGSIALIQNLVGCHNTPFVADFNRHMNVLFNASHPQVTGVVNTHDFNLGENYDFTFKVLRDLAKNPNVKFWGHELIDEVAAAQLPTIELS